MLVERRGSAPAQTARAELAVVVEMSWGAKTRSGLESLQWHYALMSLFKILREEVAKILKFSHRIAWMITDTTKNPILAGRAGNRHVGFP